MIRTLHYLKAMGFNFFEYNLKNNTKLSFDELKKSVAKCTLCQFYKMRKFTLMEPNLKPVKLMILSTLAEQSENKSGILLNSTKGDKLKLYLRENLGICEEEFYFSYVFKCFSGKKVDNFSLQSCFPFFLNELKLVRPNFLLCLGEYAFKALGFDQFNSLRGEIFSYNESFIMPSFELEFIEKNPSYEKIFIQDLQKIKGYL